MLTEALDYPTSGDHGSTALLAGSGLLLLGVLVAGAGTFAPPAVATAALVAGFLVQLPVRGYYVRVLRATAAESEPTAPSFGAPARLLRDGVVAVVVGVAYLLPAGLLFAVAAGGNLVAAVRDPTAIDPATVAAAETVGGLAALFGLFALLAAAYLVPAAVTMYAHEGRVGAAFGLRRIVDAVLSEDYAVGWLLTTLLQFLFLPVAVLFYSLLIGFVFQFLLGVAVRYVWGSAVGSALSLRQRTVDTEGITPDSGPGRTSGDRRRATGDGRGPTLGDDGGVGRDRVGPRTEGATRDPMADESER
ncbi:DUF4013 domain-containing protein [Halorarius halobius]|uniref:DUF4013 domain-containing protein n=1 Tax=Halorarius halobius TaxID=2962671 RepID=UPI0020CC27E7|nr:DUF4013 domain-containing protein [Halorarius halobius]